MVWQRFTVMFRGFKVSLVISCVLASTGVAGAAETWYFDDTQYNEDPDYEYRVLIFKWVDEVPEYVDTEDYNYGGQVGEPGFEMSYWTLDVTVIVPENGALVWGEVYNRINGGAWTHVDTLEGELGPP